MAGRKKSGKIKQPAAKLARTKKELAEEQAGIKKPARVGLSVKVAKTKRKTDKRLLRKSAAGPAPAAVPAAAENVKKPNRPAPRPREIDSERIDREKRLIMLSGVTFFMVLVGFFWLYNTKAVFERTKIETKGSQESIDWDELTENISENIEKMKEGLESVKSISEEAQAGLLSGEAGSGSTSSEVAGIATATPDVVSEEKIEALKKKLETIAN